jgi:DNA polymerase-1
MNGWEADDIIAHIATRLIPKDTKAVIVSNDKDFLQLLPLGVDILRPLPNGDVYVTRNDTQHQLLPGLLYIDPHHFLYYLALMGDSSDSIEGVPGIGEVTAAKIILEYEKTDDDFGTVEDFLAFVKNYSASAKSKKLKALADHLRIIERNIELIKLPVVVPKEVDTLLKDILKE